MKYFLPALFSLLNYEAFGQCVAAGPNNSSTFSNNSSVGSFAWSNTPNAQSSNNSLSSASHSLGVLASANSNYLVTGTSGFNIPSSASICGIEVEVERRSAVLLGVGGSVRDNSVRIVKGGTITGTDHASTNNWPSGKAYATYGNSTDLWGESWTPADINAANFGVAISARLSSGLATVTRAAEIDHIRITVFYAIILPVKFEQISASPLADKIKLSWSTEFESNSSHFIVQKLIDNNTEWEKVDSVKAVQNSSNKNYYEAFDFIPTPLNNYRIKQVDTDGRFIYSKTISARYNEPANYSVKLYPNPVSDKLNIDSKHPIIHIKLTDIAGKEVIYKTPLVRTNFAQLNLVNLKAGIYMLSIKTTNGEVVDKIIHQ